MTTEKTKLADHSTEDDGLSPFDRARLAIDREKLAIDRENLEVQRDIRAALAGQVRQADTQESKLAERLRARDEHQASLYSARREERVRIAASTMLAQVTGEPTVTIFATARCLVPGPDEPAAGKRRIVELLDVDMSDATATLRASIVRENMGTFGALERDGDRRALEDLNDWIDRSHGAKGLLFRRYMEIYNPITNRLVGATKFLDELVASGVCRIVEDPSAPVAAG